MSSVLPQVETDERPPVQRYAVRALLTVVVVGFAAFWIWALFFASKEAVNRIDDRDWAARAEQICTDANDARLELSDYRTLAGLDEAEMAALMQERADIVDAATDIVEQMIDDVVAIAPTDEKGRAIVPQWEAEYRSYIEGRRVYADQLRETGENVPFYEPGADGIPVSERLETFAGDNEMPSCAPPRDLTR
jgi:hypothetical protein